jgi:hypothetical protein
MMVMAVLEIQKRGKKIKYGLLLSITHTHTHTHESEKMFIIIVITQQQ